MLNHFVEQLCDTFRDGLCISNRSGIIVFVNKKYSEVTGIPREDILGKAVAGMVQNGVFDLVLNPEVVRGKQTATRVQTLANGRKLVLEGHPIFDEQGEVAYVATFMRDVTALSELREELAAQKELLETFRRINSTDTGKLLKYPRTAHSQVMRRLYGEAETIAAADATVLLLGETGVGKDVLARRIHAASPRAGKAFIKVDCGSIPEHLIETELFGYTAGSFSGANKSGKAGLIEAANEGTLFLDEIGELPLAMQSRLLRVLQDWEIVRVGATAPRRVDVRIIAATNKDLEKEVQKGRFRKDLYYRLKVVVLAIPPLRMRQADILPLAHSFLNYYAGKYGRKITITHQAEQKLLDHSWPGNVRELENLIQGLVITCNKDSICCVDLPLAKVAPREVPSQGTKPLDLDGRTFKDIMREMEDMVIKAGLEQYGSITEAARHFQVDRSTIFRKVKAWEKDGK
jgi:PAS domain S-box-containing protein